MPAICNLVTMWLDCRDSPSWQNFTVTYYLCWVQQTKSQILTTLGLMTLPLISCHWGFQEKRGSTLPIASQRTAAWPRVVTLDWVTMARLASSLGFSGKNRSHLLVWCPPEGQWLLHMPALLQQAVSLMGGQAQKSNLKKVGWYMKNITSGLHHS